MIHILRLFLVLSLVHLNLRAEEDAASLHKHLSDRLTKSTSIRVVATSSSMQNARVRITAKRGDKFVVELRDRTIVCDGKSVWNYTPSRNSVVISKYSARSNALSVEKLLLEVIGKYKPTALRTENNSASGPGYVLTLDPNGAELYGVKSIVLSVSKKGQQIRRVSMTTDQGKQDWTIQSLELNATLSDSIFSFNPPKNVEVVDLRE